MVDDLLAVGDRVAGWARPGEQIEAVVVHERETEVRVYDGEVESLTVSESSGIGIRVIAEHRQGFAYAGTLDADVLAETLDEARDNARFGEPDEFHGLAEPDGIPQADLVLYDPALEQVSTDAKIALALELERAVLGGDARIIGIEAADYADSVAASAVVSTAGIRTAGIEGGCYLSAASLAAEGDDVQTGFGFSVARAPGTLELDVAAADAVERAVRLLGARKAPTGRLTVVLDPFVTAQFLGIVGATLNAEYVLKGRSLFADRLGDDVASSILTLVDDPTDAAAFSATEADGEGLATRRNVLIDGGRLAMFAQNSYTGRRMGTPSTASAVRGYSSTPGVGCVALSLAPGVSPPDELIAGVDDGLLVQDVAGLHSGVNVVSGDLSTGASGLRIRNGAVAEPVREVTIASTIQRMLRDVRAVGDDVTQLPMNASGVTLVIDDVTMSGA